MNNSLGLHNTGGSMDNTVEKNSFINNEVQVKFIAGRNQRWDGNYWSDYLGLEHEGVGHGRRALRVQHRGGPHLLEIPRREAPVRESLRSRRSGCWKSSFPLMKVPRVTDRKPSMLPLHKDWKEALARYPVQA